MMVEHLSTKLLSLTSLLGIFYFSDNRFLKFYIRVCFSQYPIKLKVNDVAERNLNTNLIYCNINQPYSCFTSSSYTSMLRFLCQ